MDSVYYTTILRTNKFIKSPGSGAAVFPDIYHSIMAADDMATCIPTSLAAIILDICPVGHF